MAALDHLVVAARTLAEGVAWCEQTLGITPGPGGDHPSMGTHNRLFAIGSTVFPRAYFEIIAIDPSAPHGRSEGADSPSGGPRGAPWVSEVVTHRARWFDLDDAVLQAAIAQGPQLVHWVARTAHLDAAIAALAAQGIDAGSAQQASRTTAHGELRWRIAVRDDGARLFGGALPLPIEWGAGHPTDAMNDSGVTLASLRLAAPDPVPLRRALIALGLAAADVAAAGSRGPALTATLHTPRGAVTLTSPH